MLSQGRKDGIVNHLEVCYGEGKGTGDEETLSEAGYLGRKRLPVTT